MAGHTHRWSSHHINRTIRRSRMSEIFILAAAVCGELASGVYRKSRELSAKSNLKFYHLMLGFMYISSFARGHDMPLSGNPSNYFSTLLPSITRSNGRTRPYSMEQPWSSSALLILKSKSLWYYTAYMPSPRHFLSP